MSPLLLGLHVDDFICFLEDPAVEALFSHLLSELFKVDFMGIIEWFLEIHLCGMSRLLLLPRISINRSSINQVLQQIWLKASSVMCTILPPQPHLIVIAQLRLHLTMMTPLLRSGVKKPTNV